MEWAMENWFLLLLLGGCLGMHFFMHGHGHGNHGNHHTHVPSLNRHDGVGDPGARTHSK